MDKFAALQQEKQDAILNAGLSNFARSGYKKTSVSDIAQDAAISKALVFHYFSSKMAFYLFLYDYCIDMVFRDIKKYFDMSERDFFARIKQMQQVKLNAMSRYPSSYDFLKSASQEQDAEVAEQLARRRQEQLTASSINFFYEGLDVSLFKDGIDVKKVMTVILWCAEGFIGGLPQGEMDVAAVCEEFDEYLALLKTCFYKEV